jgi:predicted transcriptional regulator
MKDMAVSAVITTGFDNYEQQQGDQNDVHNKLIRYINGQPGIRYRELLRVSGLSNGVLTYHITNLENVNGIQIDLRIYTIYHVTIYIKFKITEKRSANFYP